MVKQQAGIAGGRTNPMNLIITDDQGNILAERELDEQDDTMRVRVKAGSLPVIRREEQEQTPLKAYH